MNIVDVLIQTELGCDPLKGEYSASIVGFVGALDLTPQGGVDDVSLITQAVEDFVVGGELELCEEGFKEIRLQESGEWEDVFWHKYYILSPDVVNGRVVDC